MRDQKLAVNRTAPICCGFDLEIIELEFFIRAPAFLAVFEFLGLAQMDN